MPIQKISLVMATCVCLGIGVIYAQEVPVATNQTSQAEQGQDAPQALNPSSGNDSSQDADAIDPALRSMSLDERLNQKVSLNLKNIDINEALKFVASKGLVNIVTSKNVSGRVTLALENVSLRDVFDLMLRINSLAYIRQGDIFNLMTEAEYKALYGRNFYDMRQVKILRLKYAVPEQAFSLLDALKSEIGRVLVDQESGNVLIMDTPERTEMMTQALHEFEKENVVEVFTLKNAKAKEAEEILKTRLDAKKVGSIKADERSNQLIVQTLAERMQEIRDLIAILDKPTKQVLLDTKIVKVKLSDQIDKGIEWEGIFQIANKLGPTYFGSYPFSNMVAGNSSPSFTSRADVYANNSQNIAYYPFSGTTGLLNSSQKVVPGQKMHIGMMRTDRDFDVMINYLNSIGQTRVLSNPKLLVVNNQEAKLHVGERQAYVTTTTTTGAQSASTVAEDVQFVDVGIQLAVTATINDDGFILLKVRPEISSVSSVLITPTKNQIPIIDTSLTETTILVKDGVTILIGGMRKEEKTKVASQTPLLGNIPFIGNAFKASTDKVERVELLVVITPHIISGAEFNMGDERPVGEQPGKEYEEYQTVFTQKKPKEGVPDDAQTKSYREYAPVPEVGESKVLMKGMRYDTR